MLSASCNFVTCAISSLQKSSPGEGGLRTDSSVGNGAKGRKMEKGGGRVSGGALLPALFPTKESVLILGGGVGKWKNR